MVDLGKLKDDDLPRLWAETMEEMLRRGIVSTRNNPIADIGERVAADHVGGEVAGSNAAGYDVKVGKRKIQVKAARVTGRAPALSPIRSLDFDGLVVVLFDSGLRVLEILEIDRTHAEECWRHSAYVNGYLLSLSKIRRHRKVRELPIQGKWAK